MLCWPRSGCAGEAREAPTEKSVASRAQTPPTLLEAEPAPPLPLPPALTDTHSTVPAMGVRKQTSALDRRKDESPGTAVLGTPRGSEADQTRTHVCVDEPQRHSTE